MISRQRSAGVSPARSPLNSAVTGGPLRRVARPPSPAQRGQSPPLSMEVPPWFLPRARARELCAQPLAQRGRQL
jgi:hypothetical protein